MLSTPLSPSIYRDLIILRKKNVWNALLNYWLIYLSSSAHFSVSLTSSLCFLSLTNLHHFIRSGLKWSAKCRVLLKGNRLEQHVCFLRPVKTPLLLRPNMNYNLRTDESSLQTYTCWERVQEQERWGMIWNVPLMSVRAIHVWLWVDEIINAS